VNRPVHRLCWFALALGVLAVRVTAADDPMDSVERLLSASAFDEQFRFRMSGLLDLEGYSLDNPDPGLIFADGHDLFNPRLSLFLDAQAGSHVYAFVQARVDRGFDPGYGGLRMRLYEYALRISPVDGGKLDIEAGKFATVVGSWSPRHDSWDNPLITAPLPYENLTGIWDTTAIRSGATLLDWAGVSPRRPSGAGLLDKDRSVPIIWGPSYATGAALLGSSGPADYALEVKNASLSSRPEVWDPTQTPWGHPTLSGRLGIRPNESWTLGISASSGAYLRDAAASSIPAGENFGNYRETLVGADAAFAWHHFQLWSEIYAARFEIPRVANADTLAYYLEAKWKLSPQLTAAVRWNQQLFGDVPNGLGSFAPWGPNVWRMDAGPGFRFTAHLQLKLQYSLERVDDTPKPFGQLLSAQLTLRF